MSRLYLKNLDGLRTIAFLAVFFSHCFVSPVAEVNSHWLHKAAVWLSRNGDIGVNFFFVLSGFLITLLLLVEEKQTGRISIKNFYIRRTLRIWPLYFLMLGLGFLVYPAVMAMINQPFKETSPSVLYLMFVSNFSNIYYGLPGASFMGVLWSVGIEEQFYLAWPIILIALKRARWLIFPAFIATTLIFRWFNFDTDQDYVYYHTLNALSDLAIGGLVAYFVSLIGVHNVRFTWNRYLRMSLYTLGVISILFRQEIFYNQFLHTISTLFYGTLFAFIILDQVFGTSKNFKVENYKLLTGLGKYTYGLYCIQLIGIEIVFQLFYQTPFSKIIYWVVFIQPILAIGICLILAWLLFRFIETPFLQLKSLYTRI